MKRRAHSIGALAVLALFLSCGTVEPPPIVEEEICTNGIDDDEDGDRDCADLECAGAPNCDEICDNAQDDDIDGAFDCADSDCTGAPNCVETCDNALDDDADGDFDCADSDCNGAPNCIPEGQCADGLDDDSDGLIDCDDSDCVNEPICLLCDPANDDCEGEEICIVDQCEPAFNRVYTFSGFQLNINEDFDSGDGNPPDPKVELHLNGDQILETPNQSDTFDATYNDTVNAEIPAGSVLEVRVLDVDGNDDDFILNCFADPLSADLLRGRAVLCEDPGIATLTFDITPN